MKMRTIDRLNVRTKPDASTRDTVVTVLPRGTVVEVEPGTNGWGSLQLQVAGTTVTGRGYVSLQWLQRVAVDPIPARVHLGLHCMTSAGAAWDAARRGCRAIVLMDGLGANNNAGEAVSLKRAFPQCHVIYRHYWPHGFVPSEEQVVAALPRDPDLIYSIFNEGDTFGMSPLMLQVRARAEVGLARTLRAAGGYGKVLVGGFAMLNPDWRDPAVRAVFRDEYAPAYNMGLVGFDQHTYTPTLTGYLDEDGAGNWRQLFADDIGFDPSIRAVYSTETGVDEPFELSMGWQGRGGFPALGVDVEGFRGWCDRYLAYQAKPLAGHPSPMRAACLYQLGGNGDPQWDRHDLRNYLGALQEFWR